MNYWIKLVCIIGLSYLSMAAQAQKKKVGCIGDSVTKGYGISVKGGSYPEQLQVLLGEEYEVGNFGHSGATLLEKGHNPYVKTKEYQEALDFAPDIIVVALGLNDTDPRNWPNYGTEFVADYSSLIAGFKKVNPAVEVYLCRMTPIFSGHSRFLSGTRDWFNAIQELIPAIAQANGAQLIDNYSPLAVRMDLFDDFLHPNAQGAGILAATVHRGLRGASYPLALDPTLGSGMVLQRDRANLIFGRGTTGQELSVELEGRRYTTVVDQQGDWSVSLPTHSAGGPFAMTVRAEGQELKLEDVWFGDVYLVSGQSNMAFSLRGALGGDQLIAAATEGMPTATKAGPVRLYKSKIWSKQIMWLGTR